MPPKPATKKLTKKGTTIPIPVPVKVSAGAGMTAGLEMWRVPPAGPFILVDTTTDNRFATDVATWNAAARG